MNIEITLPLTIPISLALNYLMKRKVSQITVRVDEGLLQRFEKCCAHVRIGSADVVRASLEAICEEVERKGEIMMPFQIVSKVKKTDATLGRNVLADTRRSTPSIHYLAGKEGIFPESIAADVDEAVTGREEKPIEGERNRPSFEEQARNIPGRSVPSKRGSKKS